MTNTISKKDEKDLVQILSHFETRSNKDIQRLMEISFKAGLCTKFTSFESFMGFVKRELLNP